MSKLFTKTNKKLETLKEMAINSSCHTAAKMKTGLKGDSPVTIHCYGEAEFWESRYLAYHFFMAGAMACDGCESDRYWRIVSDLELMEADTGLHTELGGTADVASDGEPVRRMVMRVA